MKWINHQLTAFSLTFAATGNAPFALVATAGTNLPDMIEFAAPGVFRKHRGISHNIFFWMAIYMLVSLIWIILFKSPPIPYIYISFIFVGALVHLLTDAASISGIPIWRNKKIAFGLYKTSYLSEYIVSAVIILICLLIRPPTEIITSLEQTIKEILPST